MKIAGRHESEEWTINLQQISNGNSDGIGKGKVKNRSTNEDTISKQHLLMKLYARYDY
jgi:hypothetical protein